MSVQLYENIKILTHTELSIHESFLREPPSVKNFWNHPIGANFEGVVVETMFSPSENRTQIMHFTHCHPKPIKSTYFGKISPNSH